MKKGKVIKIKNRYAMVLGETFEVERIQMKDGLQIGANIYYAEDDLYTKPVLMNQPVLKYLAAVITLFVILAGALSLNIKPSYDQIPVAVVTVDINPSIKLVINEASQVIQIKALNKDAANIVDKDYLGKPLEEVLDAITLAAEAEGFLVNDDYILIALAEVDEDYDIDEIKDKSEATPSDEASDKESSEDSSEEGEKKFEDAEARIEAFIAKKSDQFQFVIAKNLDQETEDEAKRQGMSLGKYTMMKFLGVPKEEIQALKITALMEMKTDAGDLRGKKEGNVITLSEEDPSTDQSLKGPNENANDKAKDNAKDKSNNGNEEVDEPAQDGSNQPDADNPGTNDLVDPNDQDKNGGNNPNKPDQDNGNKPDKVDKDDSSNPTDTTGEGEEPEDDSDDLDDDDDEDDTSNQGQGKGNENGKGNSKKNN